MNKFTKVGISALAGSLASFAAANAVEMTASGSAKITYHNGNPDEVTGNPYGMNTSIAFSGSGEVNGYATSLTIVNNDANTGLSSAALSVDLGDMGKITFDQGTGAGGLSTIDDKTPTAAEEVWDGLDSVAGANDARVGMGNSGAFVYDNAFSGFNLSAQFAKGASAANSDDAVSGAASGSGTSWDFALTTDMYEGMSVGGGLGRISNGSTLAVDDDTDEHTTVFANYTMGMITAGVQLSEIDKGTQAKSDESGQAWGISANINDNLSISYGEREVEYDPFTGATVTEDNEGVALAYTMGSAKVTVQQNEATNNGGTVGTVDETTQVALSLSF